jgi:hypothetical protein
VNNLDSRLVRTKRRRLNLLPVQGSDTQWYRNVLKNPQIRIDARGAEEKFRASRNVP